MPERKGVVFLPEIAKGQIGDAVQQASVRQMLRRSCTTSGIDKRVHAHGLRHSSAANMAAEGLPLNLIQRQLGYSNVATSSSSRYIGHVQPADVVAAVQSMA